MQTQEEEQRGSPKGGCRNKGSPVAAPRAQLAEVILPSRSSGQAVYMYSAQTDSSRGGITEDDLVG